MSNIFVFFGCDFLELVMVFQCKELHFLPNEKQLQKSVLVKPSILTAGSSQRCKVKGPKKWSAKQPLNQTWCYSV